MKQLIEYSLGKDEPIMVEVEGDEGGSGFLPAGREEIVAGAVRSLNQALDEVKAVSGLIVTKLMSLAHAPEETSVELGFKLGAQGKAILVASKAEGHFTLRMKWKGKPKDA